MFFYRFLNTFFRFFELIFIKEVYIFFDKISNRLTMFHSNFTAARFLQTGKDVSSVYNHGFACAMKTLNTVVMETHTK